MWTTAILLTIIILAILAVGGVWLLLAVILGLVIGWEDILFMFICFGIGIVTLIPAFLLDGWIYKDESGFPLDKSFGEMTKKEEKAAWRFVGLSLLLAIPLIAVAAWLYYF